MARRHTRFVRPAPRTKIWIGAGLGKTTIVATSKTLLGSLNAAALALRPFTVLRTRLLLGIETDQVSADEVGFGAYGEIVVTSDASAIGATAIPDPGRIAGDADAPWYVHQPMAYSFQTLSGAGFDPLMMIQYVVDSKAMRKVGPNDDLVSIYSEEGSVGAVITVLGRQLIQLH